MQTSLSTANTSPTCERRCVTLLVPAKLQKQGKQGPIGCHGGLTSQSNATASPHIAACMRSTASDGISSPSPNEGVKGSKLLALSNTLDAGIFGNAQIPRFGRMQPRYQQ